MTKKKCYCVCGEVKPFLLIRDIEETGATIREISMQFPQKLEIDLLYDSARKPF